MKELNSETLLMRTKSLVAEERRVTLTLIEHLAEIQRRMLYAELGYGSLWEFATQELGLSEGAAQRRIQAMRLVRDVPEAKAALATGKLSLSNAAKVQSFRQAEKKHGRKPDAKLLVAQVESLSQRECERKLFEISPEALPRERERIVSAVGDRELRIIVSSALHQKLKRLKGMLAHAMPDATYGELLDRLATDALAQLDKKRGTANDASTALAAAAAVQKLRTLPVGRRVALPMVVKRAVWARGGGQCEIYIEGRSGNSEGRQGSSEGKQGSSEAKRCTSIHRLEIDHKTPLALGGSNELSNLRLACWHHNQQQAREVVRGQFSKSS